MKPWWRQSEELKDASANRLKAVAYFRHSAQDRQENSIPIQREQVQEFATKYNLEIIQEFSDHGKSGLSTEHRDAFNDMIENWVKKRDDFKYILVLDVSRWGRFQDTDLSATYSSECTKHGKQVIYTSIGFPKENDPLYSIFVGFERFRAAQYSRELSDKVFKGCAKIAQQGYRPGGTPPYGLSRLLLSEARKPVQILKPGERKSIQNQRVSLAPGDDKQAVIIRRIFQSFVDGALENAIAESLNRDGVGSPGGKSWDAAKVKKILVNEAYIGTLVYNKTTQRLLSHTRINPQAEWIRSPKSFKAIISKEMFEKAQQIYSERVRIKTPENMLARLKAIFKQHGFISNTLIRADEKSPSLSRYHDEYGNLDNAFLSLHPQSVKSAREKVKQQLMDSGLSVEEFSEFLVLKESLTVLVQPSIPIFYGCRVYWFFAPTQRPEIDITLGVPLSCPEENRILGYLALPRMLVRAKQIRISGPSSSYVELYGHNGLQMIGDLLS